MTSQTPAPAAYVPDTLAELADLFGRARLHQLLAGLDAEIVSRLGPIERAGRNGDATALSDHAHALVSASGSLGFMTLSEACARLEAACLRDENRASALDDVLSAAASARRAIAALRDAA